MSINATTVEAQGAFPIRYNFVAADIADLTGEVPNPLDQFSDLKSWVVWKMVINPQTGNLTKTPFNPATGMLAATDNSLTWNTRAKAEERMKQTGFLGVGFILGDTLEDPDWRLVGVDLDGCLSEAGLAPWAKAVLDRFSSYAEVSPSGTGIKMFIRAPAADVIAIETLSKSQGGGETGRQFGKGGHCQIEMYWRRRFFTVTGHHFDGSPATLATTSLDALRWLMQDFGPSFKAAQKRETSPPKSGVVDRSVKLQAIAHECSRDGLDYHAFKARAMADPDASGHVNDQKDPERALKRAWKKAASAAVGPQDFEDLPPLAKTYEATESGIGLEFVARHGDRYRFDHDRGRWYAWDGSTWAIDATDTAKHAMDKIARRKAAVATKDGEKRALLRAATITGAATLAARNPAVAVTSQAWDADAWLMGTPGGTIDLRTGDIRDPDPADLITKRAGAAPIPLAEFGAGQHCPTWGRFLGDTTGGDAGLIRYLQQWAGCLLTGDTRAEELLFIHGPGGGGKSTFLNTLAAALGDYATAVPSDALTMRRHEQHPTEIARLKGARLAYCSELPEGSRWNENRIKEMTGGDMMAGRFMRQDYFEFKPQLKLVIVGNNAPSFANVDRAIRRRFNVVAFPYIPKVKDEKLKDRLLNELPGILSWAIEGVLDWQRNGFIKPAAVIEATRDYLESQDHFAAWLNECCETSEGYAAQTVELFESWRSYAWRESIDAGSMATTFAVKLRDAGFQPSPNKITGADRTRKKGWLGLRLASGFDDLLT